MERRANRGYKGIGMDGIIATWYANTRGKYVEEHRQSARRVASHLSGGTRVLEIAPGPGYAAMELAKMGLCTVTGVDISESFVRIATEKARQAGVQIDFRQGDAAALPFEDGSFDLTYCEAAFKNFSHPAKAIEEMYRVLRVSGTALIYDLRPDVSDDAVASYLRDVGLGPVNAFVTRLTFKYMLVPRAHARERLQEMVAATPFGTCEIREEPLEYEVVLRK
jgi:ubiquinone/menaquinone biosynthesis C-methylase UbiE